MINRRNFMQCLVLAATSPAVSTASRASDLKTLALRPDPQRIIDLPDGFSYTVVSRAGQTMSDGLTVPPAHDGMAAFPGEDGRVILVCNHEMAT